MKKFDEDYLEKYCNSRKVITYNREHQYIVFNDTGECYGVSPFNLGTEKGHVATWRIRSTDGKMFKARTYKQLDILIKAVTKQVAKNGSHLGAEPIVIEAKPFTYKDGDDD